MLASVAVAAAVLVTIVWSVWRRRPQQAHQQAHAQRSSKIKRKRKDKDPTHQAPVRNKLKQQRIVAKRAREEAHRQRVAIALELSEGGDEAIEAFLRDQGPGDAHRREDLMSEAPRAWETFYARSGDRFYRDRQWIRKEFPELMCDEVRRSPEKWRDPVTTTWIPEDETRPLAERLKGKRVVMEPGCGVGNTIFPLIRASEAEKVFCFGYDVSVTAIEVLRQNEEYDPRRIHAFVADMSDPATIAAHVPDSSVDAMICIFALGALDPAELPRALSAMYRAAKPGAVVVIRDHGVGDITELRQPPSTKLGNNLYEKGDGTRNLYFSRDYIVHAFEEAGFHTLSCDVIKKTNTNRKTGAKMPAVWVQGKWVASAKAKSSE